MQQKNKIPQKLLALLLAVCTVFACGSAAYAAAASNNSPIIYVLGRSNLYNKISTSNPQMLPYSTDAASDALIKEAVPLAARAVLTGDWDTYSNKTYAMLMQMFKGFPLNEDGEVTNDTGVLFTWSEDTISTDVNSNDLYTYQFAYDCRLSPLEIADDLNDYIEAVKRVTGKKKVSLVGRCLGANVLMAYLYKYQERINYRGIESVVLYDSSVNGVDILDAGMSGTIVFEPYALSKFLDGYKKGVTNENLATIMAVGLQMMQSTYGIEMTANFANNFYNNVKYSLIQRFLKSTYGTAPGFWSMVNEHYEEAKAYIFSEPGDAVKYSRLITKIDTYRNKVQLRAPTMIKNMRAAGVHVGIVCKYGYQGYPITEGAYKLTDNTTSLYRQSFGATCSDMDSTLGTAYIEAANAKGKGKYISPDGQVDASTGLLPEYTWYIKNYVHNQFYKVVEPLIFAICRNKIDINSNAAYPQFLILVNTAKMVPMTKENCDPRNEIHRDGDSSTNLNFLQRLSNVLQLLLNILNRLLSRVKIIL